jgi:hypothetical protein
MEDEMERRYYEVSLYSGNFDAEVVVRVRAYDESNAINIAMSCMHPDFAPQLHHDVTLSECQ